MHAQDGHVGQPGENIDKPGLWVDVVHFGGLCPLANYAERSVLY